MGNPVHVGHDQKRRVFQGDAVLKKLTVGLVQVGVAALVLPTEASATPSVSPAIATARLVRALLEREPFACRVRSDRIDNPEQRAQIVEVALRRTAFFELDVSPLAMKSRGFIVCVLWPSFADRNPSVVSS